MKILFYDIKEFEFDYLSSHISNNIEPYFFRFHLNSQTYIDNKYIDCDAISLFTTSEITKEILSKFKNLKYIFLRCSGYSNVDVNYCKRHNIKVFNTPNYGSSTIAEYAFGLILNIVRKITKAQYDLYKGEANHDELRGFELKNKTLGIIGLGHIGKKIAEIAKGFNMKSVIFDIKKEPDYNYVEIDELYETSDIIVVSCPLTKDTKGMINKDSLNKMKKSAILINIARGEIVDTEALLEALVKKRIAAAALDVIECEETMCELWDFCKNTQKQENCLKKFLFIQKLKTLENVIITPHIAYNTKEAAEEILKMTLDNIQSSFKINKDTKNLVVL